jgi:hypothetical protein
VTVVRFLTLVRRDDLCPLEVSVYPFVQPFGLNTFTSQGVLRGDQRLFTNFENWKCAQRIILTSYVTVHMCIHIGFRPAKMWLKINASRFVQYLYISTYVSERKARTVSIQDKLLSIIHIDTVLQICRYMFLNHGLTIVIYVNKIGNCNSRD